MLQGSHPAMDLDRPMCDIVRHINTQPEGDPMAKRESISVSVTPEQAAFLASCVASGRYQSTSEVIREGLRLLEDRQRHFEARLAQTRTLLKEGVDDLEAGRVISSADFFAEWDEELAARADRPGSPQE